METHQDTVLKISNNRQIHKNYLYASVISFILVTVLVFYSSSQNWLEQRSLLDLYYFPVLIAAISLGWKWGMSYSLSATVITLLFISYTPARLTPDKTLFSPEFITRTIMLNMIGILGGFLADQERHQKKQLLKINQDLKTANTDLQQRIIELTLLYDTARQLSSTLNIDHIINGILESVLSSFKANSVFIYLLNTNTNNMERQYSKGLLMNCPQLITHNDGTDYFDTLQHHPQPILIPDIEHAFNFRFEFDDPDKIDICGLVAVPLMTEKRLIGLILITTSRSNPPIDQITMEMFCTLASNAALAIDNAITYHRVNQAYVDIIGNMVSTIENQDLASIHHCQRSLVLATELAQKFKMSADDIIAVRYLLLINQLGHISSEQIVMAVGEEYWNKWQELSAAQEGTNQPRSVELLSRVAPIVDTRFEWFDGSGIPNQTQGENIPLAARIFAIVDTYHQLVFGNSHTPQRQTVEETIRYLQSRSGNQFDPQIVDEFIKIIKPGNLN